MAPIESYGHYRVHRLRVQLHGLIFNFGDNFSLFHQPAYYSQLGVL